MVDIYGILTMCHPCTVNYLIFKTTTFNRKRNYDVEKLKILLMS